MKTVIFSILMIFSFASAAENYSPYNQQYTMNYNTGCSNWQSCFGPGINTAAVTLVGGIVNAFSRPDPQVVYVNQNQQPQVVQGQYPQQTQYQGQAYPQQMQYQNGGYPYGYQAGPPNPYNQAPVYGAR
nr:MAG: hypothetical protein [Caudoviricetes sp.]